MLLNGKQPSQVGEFSAENCSNESFAKVAKFCLLNPYKFIILGVSVNCGPDAGGWRMADGKMRMTKCG